ncbi:MAG: hypothetical protein ACI8W8_001016 [Rhodothermales bacterium]|jgi:hypothetical protein
MHTNESTPPILIAFELSNKTWQTASTDGKRTRYKSLPAHDMEAHMAEIKHLPGTSGWNHRHSSAVTKLAVTASVASACSIS